MGDTIKIIIPAGKAADAKSFLVWGPLPPQVVLTVWQVDEHPALGVGGLSGPDAPAAYAASSEKVLWGR